jgi:translation initiation factor 1
MCRPGPNFIEHYTLFREARFVLGSSLGKTIKLGLVALSLNIILNAMATEPKEYKFVAVLRIEKGGRGGKTVTVIDQLPKQELFLRELTSELKKKCGVGGTYITDRKEGVIEIQGDKREMIKALLEKKGIKSKG